MKPLYASILLLCSLLAFQTARAQQHQFGLASDFMVVEIRGITDLGENYKVDLDNFEINYLTIGAFYRWQPYKRRLSYRLGLAYGQLGFVANAFLPFESTDFGSSNYYNELQLDILHLPLTVELDLGHGIKARLGGVFQQFFVNPQTAFEPERISRIPTNHQLQDSLEEAINTSHLLAQAGLIIAFGRVELTMKYTRMLTDLFGKVTLPAVDRKLDASYQLFQFGLGYRLLQGY